MLNNNLKLEFRLDIAFIFVLSSFAISLFLNSLLLKFSKNLGTRTTGEVRFASTSKPSLGGITFYIVFLFAFLSALFVFPEFLVQNNLKTSGLFTATTLGFILGFTDDAYNTNPTLKFVGQAICGLALVFSGIFIPLVPAEIQGSFVYNALFTIFWVIGIMNSINMLDNMDGITTLISISICIIALYMLFHLGVKDNFTPLIILSVIASLTAFLFSNWHPAKMYMGDTGSQFLGVFLAYISILFLWKFKADTKEIIQVKQFIIPILAFIIPIIDTTTVFIRRMSRGQSPFKGGVDHTTHHFAYLGLKVPYIGIIFFLINTFSLVIIAILVSIKNYDYLYTYISIAYIIGVFVLIQFLYEIGNRKNKAKLEALGESQKF